MNELKNHSKNRSCQFDDRTVNQRTVLPQALGHRLFKQRTQHTIDLWIPSFFHQRQLHAGTVSTAGARLITTAASAPQ